MDLLNCESNFGESDDGAIVGCRKYVKKLLYSNSDLEDVSLALRHSNISDEVFLPSEVGETSSKRKIKKKKKEIKKTLLV